MASRPTGNATIRDVIFGQCDMKTSHHSYHFRSWRDRFPPYAALAAFLFGLLPLLLASVAALGAPANSRTILSGPPPGPCAGAIDGAEYIGGTDAYGYPVAPAAARGVAHIRLGSETVYPVWRDERRDGGTEVKVHVDGLASILAAPDGCTQRR